mmetsp:Transcript_3451/g.5787  ORF Transcript_3451/g.5787 Transcript_3451/m.5787 type:complete len:208 (+) Transcript_3451:413-1036(+)
MELVVYHAPPLSKKSLSLLTSQPRASGGGSTSSQKNSACNSFTSSACKRFSSLTVPSIEPSPPVVASCESLREFATHSSGVIISSCAPDVTVVAFVGASLSSIAHLTLQTITSSPSIVRIRPVIFTKGGITSAISASALYVTPGIDGFLSFTLNSEVTISGHTLIFITSAVSSSITDSSSPPCTKVLFHGLLVSSSTADQPPTAFIE